MKNPKGKPALVGGELIKAFRVKLGLSQDEFGKFLVEGTNFPPIDQATICMWEKGRPDGRSPNKSNADLLLAKARAKSFRMTLDALYRENKRD